MTYYIACIPYKYFWLECSKETSLKTYKWHQTGHNITSYLCKYNNILHNVIALLQCGVTFKACKISTQSAAQSARPRPVHEVVVSEMSKPSSSSTPTQFVYSLKHNDGQTLSVVCIHCRKLAYRYTQGGVAHLRFVYPVAPSVHPWRHLQLIIVHLTRSTLAGTFKHQSALEINRRELRLFFKEGFRFDKRSFGFIIVHHEAGYSFVFHSSLRKCK